MFKLRTVPCTFNKTVFEEDRDSFNCQSSINVYHCIQNERNRSGEICIQPVWVQPNYCPEYNTGANTLDTVPCNVSRGCPDVLYHSNEVYKYPVCLNKTFTDSEEFAKEVISSMMGIYVGVAVALSVFIVLFAVCSILLYFRRRGQYIEKEEEVPLIHDFNLEKPFFKTSAYHEGVKFLVDGGKILCLEGRWGSGRTSTAKQVYVAVRKSSPIIISDLLTLDANKQVEPIIVDRVLSTKLTDAEKELLKEKIYTLFKNMSSSNPDSKAFIIFILGENRKTVSKFVKSIVAKTDTKFIDLSKNLTKGDRTQILSSQFETFCPNEVFSKVENLAMAGKDGSLGYPEICALFCRCSIFRNNPGQYIFCNRPLENLKYYLEYLHISKDRERFLMLVYMSLNQMEINVNNQNEMLFEILESCNCDSRPEPIDVHGIEVTGETSRTEQRSSSGNRAKKHGISKEYITSIISEEFVNKVAGASIYRLQHEVIKRMTLVVFGTHHFSSLLEFSKPEELKSWVKKKSTNIAQGDIKPVLEISDANWKEYQNCCNKLK